MKMLLWIVVFAAGAVVGGAVVGRGSDDRPAVVEPPVAKPAIIDPFDPPPVYQPQAAPADDQLARINADLARDRQVEDDAKVQARALGEELRK